MFCWITWLCNSLEHRVSMFSYNHHSLKEMTHFENETKNIPYLDWFLLRFKKTKSQVNSSAGFSETTVFSFKQSKSSEGVTLCIWSSVSEWSPKLKIFLPEIGLSGQRLFLMEHNKQHVINFQGVLGSTRLTSFGSVNVSTLYIVHIYTTINGVEPHIPLRLRWRHISTASLISRTEIPECPDDEHVQLVIKPISVHFCALPVFTKTGTRKIQKRPRGHPVHICK